MIADLFRQYVPEESVEEQWDIGGLENSLKAELALELPLKDWLQKEPDLGDEALVERIAARADDAYKAKVPEGAEQSFRQYERYVMLQILDGHWREHLAALDHLRQAKSNLENASSDKGGYRKKAIDEVNDAIDETKKGIDAGE